MPPPDFRSLSSVLPSGPVRGFRRDSLMEDVLVPQGFLAVALADGTVDLRCMDGEADLQIMVSEGDWIGPRPDCPAVLVALRATSTVGSVYIVRP